MAYIFLWGAGNITLENVRLLQLRSNVIELTVAACTNHRFSKRANFPHKEYFGKVLSDVHVLPTTESKNNG